MKKIIYFILGILISLLSFSLYYIFDDLDFLNFGQIFVWFIIYIIVTDNLKKILSLQSFFLIGYGLFILGRFFAQIFHTIPDIYCIEFIFNYCLSDERILNLNLILYLTLFFFCLPFLFNNRKKELGLIDVYYSIKNIHVLVFIQFILIAYYSYNSYKSIFLVLSSGYMALFSGQAEAYEAPIVTFIYSMIIVIFSILLNNNSSINKTIIKFMFFYFLLIMFLGILTGSRTSFLTALFIFGYYFYRDIKFNYFKIILISIVAINLIYFINILASLGGGRNFESNTLLIQVSDTLFGQGVTLMVFDASIHMHNYPLLAYLKTILPGIQVIYSFFDINNRYLFDFSSYLVYMNNKSMYFEGFGLGWSLLSDFYVFSFGFIPLYLFFIFSFAYLLKYIQMLNGSWINGFLFILATQLFTISRSSISLIILMLILYCIITLVMGSITIKKNRGF